jgi:hypothetical protein
MNWYSNMRTITFTVLAIASIVLQGSSPVHAQGVLALRGGVIETAGEEGTIHGGTILVRDGRIEAVGSDIEIPLTARIIDLKGKTVMPGFVDPYYVVDVADGDSGGGFREVTFGGRTFRIANSPAATPTAYTRIIDCFDPRDEQWIVATRSGITSAQLVSRGFGESAIARIDPQQAAKVLSDADGRLFIAVTNQSSSLEVLRKGLAEEKKPTSRGSESSADRLAALRSRMAQRGGGSPSAGESGNGDKSESESKTVESPERSKTPLQKSWDAVREGKDRLFVNVNNASAILYLEKEIDKADKARFALVADGDDLVRTYEQIDPEQVTVVMPPRISLLPNSRDRVNVARLLQENKFQLAFSLSLNQSEYLQSQESPLFAVTMLVRAGLDRDVAVKALTIVPATLLGIEKDCGSIEAGKRADFVILDDEPFSATAQVVQVLLDGKTIYEN